MTKNIHVINADSAAFKVKVLVQDKVFASRTDPTAYEWKTVETLTLDSPGSLITKYLTNTRRIVIEENGVL